jgi:septum site-determining protein MinC
MKTKPHENTPVRLKGMGKGLCVTLNPIEPIEYLKEELSRLFKDLGHLTANSRIVIDIGKRDGYDDVIQEISEFLKEKFGIGSVSRISGKKTESETLMIRGRLRSGQKIKAKKHLILLGDLNPGAEVSAGGDILIMGSCRGIVAAGQPDNKDAIVLALDFRPTQIQIGTLMAAGFPSSPTQKQPEIAYVDNGVIVVENYSEANLFGRLPYPEIR